MTITARKHCTCPDMVEIFDPSGDLYTVTHRDLFWAADDEERYAIRDTLDAGRRLVLTVSIEEATEKPVRKR